jgi:hypothetical protein
MKNEKDVQFYEINGDMPLSQWGNLIRLNKEDMKFSMLADKCIGIPTLEDLLQLKTSNFNVFTTDDYIDKDKFRGYYAVVNLTDFEDLHDLFQNCWGNIEDEDLTEAGYTRKKVIEILKNNIIDNFDYDLITLPYWDGSNWDKLYIYDNLDFYNCHVDTAADGSSSLEPEDQSDLNRLEEIEYCSEKTYSNTLYKSPSGKYYLKEDSFWQGEYSNIFDIFTEVEESELSEILKEKFRYSRGEINDFFKKKVAITA